MAFTAITSSRSRWYAAAVIAACVCVGAAAPALADPIPAGQIRMDALRNHFSVPGGGYAGEFVVNASRLTFTPRGLGENGVNSDQFISFCVETTEYIQLNRWYSADLNTETLNTHEPLHQETAYLYSQFIKGDLAGYKFSDTAGASDTQKALSARALQEMIWYYQDPSGFAARYGADAFETGGYFKTGTALNKQLARYWYANLASWIAAPANASDMAKVRIINIWEGSDGRQDTLCMIPLPAPLWMGGLGLFAVVGGCSIRSRRQASAADPV